MIWDSSEPALVRVAPFSKDWNAVALGEKTIDLEVYVVLKSL